MTSLADDPIEWSDDVPPPPRVVTGLKQHRPRALQGYGAASRAMPPVRTVALYCIDFLCYCHTVFLLWFVIDLLPKQKPNKKLQT